jgi:SAM-dependent methyltransferase
MADPFYANRSLQVEIYDARTAHLPVVAGDAEFFCELARTAPGPSLELGCGTGRLIASLAWAGVEVTGLDRSEAMLSVAREKLAKAPPQVASRVTLVSGDMTTFRLERQFGLIFSAFRSFMLLTTPEEQRACLSSAYDHLVPGGILAIDIFDPLLHRMGNGQLPESWRDMGHVFHPVTWNAVRIEVSERTADAVNQVFEERWRFAECASDGTVLRDEEEILRMRWTYRYELRYLLEAAGFEFVAEYSDYEKSPPEYGKEILVLARKP